MNLTRFFILAFFTLPFFSFAQTNTSTAVQPMDLLEERAAVQVQIDAMINDYLKTFPTNKEIQTKALANDITIKTTPEYPGPNETVNAIVSGYLSNLGTATISWSVNGNLVEKGVGQKTFFFQNGDSGKTTTLAVSIVTSSGESIKKETSFTPIGITLLWEADTYTPPFYKGKPLLTPEARVRVIAVPDTGNASNFIYNWERNGNSLVSVSGYSKNSFSLKGPLPFYEAKIRVSVLSNNKKLESKKSISLPLTKPFILFYGDHPLFGVLYNHSIDTNLIVTEKEFSVRAEPYFFSEERSEQPILTYSWLLNGKVVLNSGRTITLRNEQGGKSVDSLALTVRGIKQTFQSARQSIIVNFDTNKSERPTF